MEASSSSSYRTSRETDLKGWRLKVGEDNHGQHKWVYLPEGAAREASPQTKADKYAIGLEMDMPDLPEPKSFLDGARNGLTFYKELQADDGHFATEYGGPLFLIPGLIVALSVTGQSLKPEQQTEMIRYLLAMRRPEGGWGLHTAAPPTVFGTVMNYVALRILGMSPDEEPMTEIRALIHEMGGAVCIPSWGKAWLSILGCYEWEGLGPVPPELWLAPDWLPFAPWRWWVHVRAVAHPTAYLYGRRWVGPITPLVISLRQELYTQPYNSIRWAKQQTNISPLDIYSPHSWFLDITHAAVHIYEHLPSIPYLSSFFPLRKKALERVYELVKFEDENTGYQTIGPVSQAFNLVARFAGEGAESYAFKQHMIKIENFLWMGKDGLMMCGTDGSQLWDLTFISQAMVETGLALEDGNKECAEGMLGWLDKAQIRDNSKHYGKDYRHRTKGAWAFSTQEQGYVVSDCIAEGLKAVISLQSLPYTKKLITPDRMRDAVDTILSMQNPNGGFASYEPQRGGPSMELLNAAEVFGNIMIDYNYPECTTSALSALIQFSRIDPEYKTNEIAITVKKAIQWIKTDQRKDGSWYGSWGICFTYATMFAVEALGITGETYENSDNVRRACDFLVSKQKSDGGWGETYMSCVTMEYVQHEKSQVVMTAWSILALIYGRYPDKSVIDRAARLIMSRQKRDGRWVQEDTEGIFNKNCAIDYPAFKFIFCIWALGRADKYLKESS